MPTRIRHPLDLSGLSPDTPRVSIVRNSSARHCVENPIHASTAKSARLEARLTGEMKTLIERAAAYEGRSVSDFVIHSAQRAALEVIEQHEVIRLNAQQSRAFAKLVARPAKPNTRLRKAFAEHRQRVHSR